MGAVVRCTLVLWVVLIPWAGAGLRAQDTLDLVKDHYVIGPTGGVADSARWGMGVSGIGDLDGDDVPDMAVSQSTYDGSRGAVWILLMNDDGTVKDDQRISNNYSGLPDTLDAGDVFGGRLAALEDLDGDGLNELAVLAAGDDDGASNRGAVYILRLQDFTAHNDTAVKGFVKISDLYGGFGGSMTNSNGFAGALAGIGDQNGDGKEDLAVGAYLSDDGGSDRGALWVLMLNSSGSVTGYRKYNSTSTWPSPGSPLTNNGEFGFAADDIGDLDGDGVIDLAVTARIQNGRGTIHFLFLNSDGTIKAHEALVPGVGSGLTHAPTYDGGHFGWSIANVGDLNGDGTDDLLNGMRAQSDSYTKDGAVSVIYLNPDGSVHWDELISQSTISGGLGLHNNAFFGWSVAAVGDIDGDAVMDIAVSANGHNGGGTLRGRVFVFELNAKPLISTWTVTDDDGAPSGAVEVSTVGGVRPYYLLHGADIPTSVEWDTHFADPDTAGFAADGFGTVDHSALDYSDLLNGMTADTSGLVAQLLPITVRDQQDSSVAFIACIGSEIDIRTSQGVSRSATNMRVQRTANSGYTGMTYCSKNTFGPGQSGWVACRLPELADETVFGLREVSASQTNGYENMLYAFYLHDDEADVYCGGTHYDTGETYSPGDRFRIEVDTAGAALFYLNDEMIHTCTEDIGDDLMMDLFIHRQNDVVEEIACSPKSIVALQARVMHSDCGSDNGAINLFVSSDLNGPITYSWTGPNGFTATTEDLTGLAPGIYTVGVTDPDGTVTLVEKVGVKVGWYDKVMCATQPTAPHTLTSDPGLAPPPYATALGENMLGAAQDVWWQFSLESSNTTSYRVIMGLRDLVSGERCYIWLNRPSGVASTVYRFVDASSTVLWMSSGPNGGSLRTNREQSGDVLIERNGNLFSMSAINASGSPFVFEQPFGMIRTADRSIIKAVASFGCPPQQFAVPEADLAAFVHRAFNKQLRFVHHEDYDAATLVFAVRSLDGAVLIDQTDQTIGIGHGFNECIVDLAPGGSELASGTYLLEVSDGKNLKRHLRFQYESSAP